MFVVLTYIFIGVWALWKVISSNVDCLASCSFTILISETVSHKTSLRIAKRNNSSMVGFPVKSLNEWQRSLVQAGFQLAVCNQTERQLVKYVSILYNLLFSLQLYFREQQKEQKLNYVNN